ncbi:MAG: Mpo1-like protein [Rhizomicrobium sp.]
MAGKIATYAEFWPYYLREHSRPETRAIHYLGTGLSTACIVALIATGNGWLFPIALVAGYAPAWIGHFFIEHNHPATFTYPLWSLASDYRMAFAWITGRLGGELARAGVAQR